MATTTAQPEAATRVSSHYAGDAGKKYVAARLANATHPGFAINAKFYAPYLRKTDTLLDFGCGNGGLTHELSKHCASVEGLEVNPAGREIASQFGFPLHTSLDALPADKKFDVISTSHVLEHVRDVPGTLERLRTHLKPGGRLIVMLPIDDWRGPNQRDISPGNMDFHLQTWTPRLFANTLYEAGFKPREVRVVTHAWSPKLFPLIKLGLEKPAFWLFSVLRKRRQLLAVAENPG